MEQVDEIKADIPAAGIVTAEDSADAIYDTVPGMNAMINCPRQIFSAEVLDRAGDSLRWIHVGGAGCAEFFIPRLVESNIVLTNGKIIQGPEAADHAMALLLSMTRNLHLVLRGKTGQSMPRPVELHGKTAVVIGLGGVGMLVAERARACGAKVIGVAADYAPMLSLFEKVYPPDRLREALAQGDVVVMAVPHTKASDRMMGSEQFAAMKPTAYYINVSRGATTDTEALTDALKAGRLQGAGLDVTDPEPLPEGHPLRHMDNVVLTPHIAGLSDHNRRRSFELIKANIERFVNNRPLINVVNKELGY